MKIAVFGAGIAGLTVAHELSRLGHDVTVYESTDAVGGFFRSARLPDGQPTEYSWHGLGPWYSNTYAVMGQIPFRDSNVYDLCLSRPIDFGIAPNHGPSSPAAVFDAPAMYRMSRRDRIGRAWLMLKTWFSRKRSEEKYARVNAATAWTPYLSDLGLRTWRATFGPWIGSDWTNVSLHQAGKFFLKNVISGPAHTHRDEDGRAWEHGGGSEWLLMRGPSSEYWFDPWVRELKSRGVRFEMNTTLDLLSVLWIGEFQDDNKIDVASATVVSAGEERIVHADAYVLATTPFAMRDILSKIPLLRSKFPTLDALVQDGPHTQIGFRLAFAEPIAWPRERSAIICGDSEWNLTLFAQEQVWDADVGLGNGVASLWTGTACACTVPGRVHGLPAVKCTREQFIEEVLAQLAACGALDALIRQTNSGRGLADFALLRLEIWHEWSFSRDGIKSAQPKWVNSTTTQPHQPPQATSLPNLALAGAHTRTQADLWSIEAAVESGRRAARVFDERVPVIDQYVPRWLRVLQRLDDGLYRLGLPHLLDIIVGLLLLAAVAGLISIASV